MTQPDTNLLGSSNKDLVRRYSEWLICQRYSRTTLEVYNRVANRFLAYWGRRHFSQATHFDIRKFILKMGERDLSGEIVHRYLWALRSFFDFLCIHGIADKSAPRLVRSRPTQRPLPRALSRQNVQRLLKATDNARDRALLEVYYSTGCRISEIIGVRLEHVDFRKRTIFVTGKSGDRRVCRDPFPTMYIPIAQMPDAETALNSQVDTPTVLFRFATTRCSRLPSC
jgi:integrase/recombinase XerC